MVNSMNDVQVNGTTGVDPNVLQTYRPNGGCAFMYSKNIQFKMKHIPVDSNNAMLCSAVLC